MSTSKVVSASAGMLAPLRRGHRTVVPSLRQGQVVAGRGSTQCILSLCAGGGASRSRGCGRAVVAACPVHGDGGVVPVSLVHGVVETGRQEGSPGSLGRTQHGGRPAGGAPAPVGVRLLA